MFLVFSLKAEHPDLGALLLDEYRDPRLATAMLCMAARSEYVVRPFQVANLDGELRTVRFSTIMDVVDRTVTANVRYFSSLFFSFYFHCFVLGIFSYVVF